MSGVYHHIRKRTDVLQHFFLPYVRSCETLALGAEEVSRQASQVLAKGDSPEADQTESELLGFALSIVLFTSGHCLLIGSTWLLFS